MTRNKKIIIAVAVVTFACTAAASTILIKRFWGEGRFALGIVIAGEDLSGKTLEEGTKILKEKEQNFLNGKIKFKLGEKAVEKPVKDLGVEISLERTIETVKNFKANDSEKPISIIKTIDGEKIINELTKDFKLEEQLPKDAGFYLDKGVLLISEEKNGTIIDDKTLTEDLSDAIDKLEPTEVLVELKNAEPKITKEAMEGSKTEILDKLSQTILLIDPIYSDDWLVKIKDHPDWVKFVQKPQMSFEQFFGNKVTPKVTIEINQEALNKFADENLSKWLDKPPEDVNIHQGNEGKFIIDGRGNDGKMIQRRLLKESIEMAIENKIRNVTIPVVTIKPKITVDEAAKKLGITERLSVGHTSYYGSPTNRVINIKAGKERFNGVVVKPDEIFSFNKTLGEVTAETGYKMELVIKPEGTIPEYGGGICQVSTTAYRAAIFAGVPIVERHQHTYAVTYYSQILGHGLDATIYLGGADLKFKNDTGNSILIQSYVDKDYELYFVFYGTKDGRSVRMEGPMISNQHGAGPTVTEETQELKKGQTKVAEKAHGGFDALWYRYVTTKTGEVIKEAIVSKYKAMPTKILIGTGE